MWFQMKSQPTGELHYIEIWLHLAFFSLFSFLALSNCVSGMWLARKQLWALQSPGAQNEVNRRWHESITEGNERQGEKRTVWLHLTVFLLHVDYQRRNSVWTESMRPLDLKRDKQFFTGCWCFIASQCEDWEGCCCATSPKSRSGTCTFCTSWYARAPSTIFKLPPLTAQTAMKSTAYPALFDFLPSVSSVYSLRFCKTNLAHVHP